MVERAGIERVGFLTITPADHVTERAEWQRRFNSFATHWMRHRYPDWMRVVERQRSGRIHAHLLVVLDADIRTGFDFEAIAARDYSSASPALRAEWKALRGSLPRFGFGRHELMPIKSTASGMANYVGKYIGKHLDARSETDKGWRLVSYGTEARVARTRFSWAQQGASWRRGCARLADMVAASKGIPAGRLTETGLGYVLGKRGAYDWRETIAALGRAE